MRPLVLTMQAFGPYKAHEAIDFADLASNRLFLIHGETGAGKTSILDAIVFALYGDTSGGERQAAQMRCESSDPALPTEVVFDFALGPRTFRIVRRPKQEIAAQRGSGLVQKQPYAAMWETTLAESGSEGKLLGSKIREVSEEVRGLLGFSSDQFRQVVVLPQGKFRDLLAAGSDMREEILRQLFRTDDCAELERRLQERAREVVRRREELLKERGIRLSTVGAEDDESLAALTKEAGKWVREAKRESRAADKVATTAAKALAEAKSADEAATAAREAEAGLELLIGQRAAFEALQEQAAWARKAEKVQPAAAAADEAAEALETAVQERDTARDELKDAVAARKKATDALRREEKREPQRREVAERVRHLSEVQKKVAAWRTADAERAAAQGRLDAAAAKVQEASDGLKTAKRGLTAAEAEAQKISSASSRLETVRLRLEQACEIAEACVKRDTAKDERKGLAGLTVQAKRDRDVAQRGFDAHRGAYEDLEVQWRAGRAAALASGLEPGSPCPVCGSLDHPAPAHGAEQVSDAALDEGRVLLEEARARLEAAKEKLSGAEQAEAKAGEKLKILKGTVRAGLTTANAESAREKCRTECEQVEAIIRDAADPEELQANAREAVEDAERELGVAQAEERTASTGAADKKGRVEQLATDVPAELRSEAAALQALEQARAVLSDLEQAFEAARKASGTADQEKAAAERGMAAAGRALNKTADRHAKAKAALDRSLARHDFEDVQSYLEASLPEAQIVEAERQITEYQTALGTATGRLEQAQRVLKKHPVFGDLSELNRAAGEAAEAAKDAQKRLAEAEERLKRLEQVGQALAELDERFKEAAARFVVIGRLDEVANGRSAAAKISFQRWVLGAYLDDVLVAASRRLFGMSRGRFRLERLREVTDRRRATGLELAVYDSYSNRSRPAVTLSGGESFQAALSLALGLAETVQERSGGTRLETIFVDEGFGALDPDSLDLAVEALMELKDSGRLVGVITHVPEMRQVIDARLEVTGGPGGSSTRFVVA